MRRRSKHMGPANEWWVTFAPERGFAISLNRAFSFYLTSHVIRHPPTSSTASQCTYHARLFAMAEDAAYYGFGDERGGPPSHFPVLQPQFRQPARPVQVPTRDRFRATQYGGYRYDDVEDDGKESEGLRFDSFGMPSVVV
jgi:hypothetical protein